MAEFSWDDGFSWDGDFMSFKMELEHRFHLADVLNNKIHPGIQFVFDCTIANFFSYFFSFLLTLMFLLVSFLFGYNEALCLLMPYLMWVVEKLLYCSNICGCVGQVVSRRAVQNVCSK